MAQQPIDPNAAISELGQIKFGETDLSGVLTQVSELARRTIPGAEEVSVTLLKQEGPHTAAFSGELALRLDELQYEYEQGPCLEAAREAAVVSVPDMAEEARWPQWAARAVQGGALSSLSIGFPIQETVLGALNIYGIEPGAFDDDAVTLAQTFAGYAAVALANAHLYDTTATLAAQMQSAMQSRAVIEQAKGIIMGERRCTPDEAFAVLAKVSQDSNRKLRDVAAALVERAARPANPKRDRGDAGHLP
ncbi:GAF and ANTAR domain-containing protein [Micromonospora sp. LAH09]|uniref:GAF and ANTAR domain-containing protein n=1 Tax=Micromonospora cabrerizensis TaxID=2911213 RepID=UPI001EE9997D|nr:GAF and ANTAR domain-containing protein [Micromonospora cabrerizensis]MCG5468485.1 GAF and ANTAR domain-containing protein [Micromonospora cabrerizensis]